MFDVSESAYDNFMGRFSVPLGPVFADFAGIAPGQRVLDVGAGTGALTSELVRRGAIPAAADPSPSFVAALRRRVPGIEVQEARAELFRQVAEPEGPFTLRGRAWAARVTRA